MNNDYDGASEYALKRLEQELAPELRYHSFTHTRDDVLPAVDQLSDHMGISGEERMLLRTAALFHDIGFLETRAEHEAAGARIAAEVLPHFGYTPEQVEAIQGMIMATRLPQTVRTPLEAIVADADLDVLGREDFMQRSNDLRAELAAYGERSSDKEWAQTQLRFICEHQYWTESARSLREAHKKHNIDALCRRLEHLGDDSGSGSVVRAGK